MEEEILKKKAIGIEKVMKQAIAEEIERRRKLGYNIAIWKDGKVVVGKVEELAPSISSS